MKSINLIHWKFITIPLKHTKGQLTTENWPLSLYKYLNRWRNLTQLSIKWWKHFFVQRLRRSWYVCIAEKWSLATSWKVLNDMHGPWGLAIKKVMFITGKNYICSANSCCTMFLWHKMQYSSVSVQLESLEMNIRTRYRVNTAWKEIDFYERNQWFRILFCRIG